MTVVIITGGSRGIGASLLSDDNRWINAQDIEVAGGYII